MDLGAPELLIILVIALLIFGSNKLPKLARSLGQASKEFKEATSGNWVEEKVTAATNPAPDVKPAATATPATATPTPTAESATAPAPTTDAPPAAPVPTTDAPPAAPVVTPPAANGQ